MHLDELRGGRAFVRTPAGAGVSTNIPDMDFETYSDAGYTWDLDINKWVSVVNSPPHGIGAVGAPVYSEHPSTEVLSLAYNLKDGRGPQLWLPGCFLPEDLFEYIATGGIIEAWNSAFEYYVWSNVCVKRMGWPELPYTQLRDAAAKSRAYSLPGALGKAAGVLQVTDQKIADGDRLIKKFSCPRNPTKNDRRRRILPSEDPGDAVNLYKYNLGDIKAESAVSAVLPDLSADELELWLTDQAINFRGVHIDAEALAACRSIVEQATAKYTAELVALTGGAVKSANELKNLLSWLHAQGVHMETLDADAVEEALTWPLPPAPRRVLEIRAMLGAASVKKLYAIDRRVSRDGRLRDLFAFCGAGHTGRFAGRGPQPQNLPASGPKLKKCSVCGLQFHTGFTGCPKCLSIDFTEIEWGVESVERALSYIASKNLDWVEYLYGDAVAVVSGCLRGLFSAAPGKDLICSDYSAIEAVVLACLAGEQWRIDVFKTHGKIYEMSASKITGIPFENFIRHKKETGDHHPMRKKVGKVAELACFGPDTLVLTDRGYKKIIDVSLIDKLWDGVQWVSHSGVVYKGKRKTLKLDGVKVTPNHPISLGLFWKGARQLALNKNTLRQALAIGSENLPLYARTASGKRGGLLLCALAATRNTSYHTLTYLKRKLRAAINAAAKDQLKHISSFIRSTRTWYPIQSIGGGLLTDSGPLLPGAIARAPAAMKTTGAGVFKCARLGADRREQGGFYYTLFQFRGGITHLLRWTASIQTKGMKSVISALFRGAITCLIEDPFQKCSGVSTTSNDVYDIVNAGPLHRFTIRTNSGHFIVHNSGYQGHLGAWKAFGADKHLSEQEIRDAISAWRRESPNIVKFWYAMEDAAVAAVRNPGQCYQYNGITWGMKGDVLYCRLLSGRMLTYHSPRLTPGVTSWGKDVIKLSYMGWNSDYSKGPIGWVRIETYGGKLTENVVQATARDILTYALVNAEKAGYPVVLHVHDEIVAEILERWGSIEEFEKIMATLPEWCKDWPIRAAGGWRGKRYRKD